MIASYNFQIPFEGDKKLMTSLKNFYISERERRKMAIILSFFLG